MDADQNLTDQTDTPAATPAVELPPDVDSSRPRRAVLPEPVATPLPAPEETLLEPPDESQLAADAFAQRVSDLRQDDRIGVVAPGDRDGLAALVVRGLGMGDAGVYDGSVVELVKQRQEEAGLEPDGIVAGQTWALVLRPVKRGDAGWEVTVLRGLLGLTGVSTTFDDEVVEAVGADRVTHAGDWAVFIAHDPAEVVVQADVPS